METIFIEIDSTVFGSKSNIIAVIYRMPDSLVVGVFDEKMCDILSVITKEMKMSYLAGDLNVDLLKHEEHLNTGPRLILLLFCLLITWDKEERLYFISTIGTNQITSCALQRENITRIC